MSATPETPQATARSPFAGCTIMIVCVLVMVFYAAIAALLFGAALAGTSHQ